MTLSTLKTTVQNYWNAQACGTEFGKSRKYSKEYFDEIEAHRYRVEPEILSFAQFPLHHGKKILEVGFGAGTDFIQWMRSGCQAYGIDLTDEGVEHVKNRLKVYNLEAQEIKKGDAENIPYPDNSFDLVYSWGVIPHTPDTLKALQEIFRVCRPGGTCKIMVYNRHSLNTFYFWLQYGLFKGKPWKSFAWILYHHMESPGTKGFTKKEVNTMLKPLAVKNIQIKPVLTYYDLLGYSSKKLYRKTAKILATILGRDRVGWYMTIEFTKND